MSNKINVKGAPKSAALPPLYNSAIPLFCKSNRKLKLTHDKEYSFAARATYIMLVANEFPAAGRDYPIVFKAGEEIFPVALTGAPGGRNPFVSAAGEWKEDAYIPLYARRYPFLLVKDEFETKRMTLCVDLTSKQLMQAADGGNLFDGGEPTSRAKAIFQFCELYETAAAATADFVRLLKALDLFIEAGADFRFAGIDDAALRDYLIVSEEKMRKLALDQALTLKKSGAIDFIHAHLFSLRNVRMLLSKYLPRREDSYAETKCEKGA